MNDTVYAQVRALVAEYGTDGGNDDLDDTVRRIMQIMDDRIEEAEMRARMNWEHPEFGVES